MARPRYRPAFNKENEDAEPALENAVCAGCGVGEPLRQCGQPFTRQNAQGICLARAPHMIEFFKAATLWPALAGVAVGFLAFRKDERTVQIASVSAARTTWRNGMRDLAAEIAGVQRRPVQASMPEGIWKLRAKLATSLNPKDPLDVEILAHFDRLFFQDATDMDVFIERIALLLKHDWERVKAEALPLHVALWRAIWRTPPEWKHEDYRQPGEALLRTEGPQDRWPGHPTRR